MDGSPLLLTYNLRPEKAKRVMLIACMLKIRVRRVSASEHSLSIGELLRGEKAPDAASAPLFTDEMLVMCGFGERLMNAFLAQLRTAKQTVALKAVLTPTNEGWSSLTLHDELCREHAAMHKRTPSIHENTEASNTHE